VHLICTHEQADFDAVASLWAASLLHPEAAPVLPRRLNRNVRGFLIRYGEDFPLRERSEIKIKTLRELTLVDSQSPVSLEGFGPDTQVNVIDHHPLQAGLDPGWELQVEVVGATATLLVESLQNEGKDLSGPSATLLLLGIYEDTGSLTYPGTTPRDIRASAWLLEQGASLAIASDFLNQPLSAEQRSLFEQSIDSPSTVGEIMSRGPQLLDPSETVAEAAERMKRYGHEGYPVTDSGEVVGLLTRRAVDRAVAHGMQSRPVSEIMEAGSLVVHPQDSIRHLQRMMIEHNWGQIPVSDPVNGEVIGIVTRTDLLNSLGNSSNSQSNQGMTENLEHALTAERLALLRLIARESEASEVALYIVGGFVRDLILGTPSVDFDLVVEGDAIALGESLAAQYGGQASSHRRFGTAKWQLDPQNENLKSALQLEPSKLPETVDFVSARTEFYSYPTALPSVKEGSIKLDLHRRDFSINTLALRLDGHHYGQLSDPWGGGKDIRGKQIRVLHSLSFVDDPTRMLRAVRLEQRLGFTIESRTLELLERALPLLDNVSGERIRSEILAILKEPSFGSIMLRLKQLGLLQAIYPALDWDDWIESRTSAAREFSPPASWKLERMPTLSERFYALWLYRLSASEAGGACERLHMSQSEAAVVMKAGRQNCDLAQSRPPSEWAECLDAEPEAALAVTWLALEDQAAARQIIENYLKRWRWVQPTVDGDRLRELGLAPGPAYGRILGALRAAWLDGEISSAEDEQQMLAALLREATEGG
jgi:tRNA nucleotidyltransferase (CCA-adding enzyme)